MPNIVKRCPVNFLPFYVQKGTRLKAVIAGGGYAGISALTTLKSHCPETDIVLVDPMESHLKVTHLHETFRRPMQDLTEPYSALGSRLGFRHVPASLSIDEETLKRWQLEKCILINEEYLEFDYLLIAIGARARTVAKPQNVFDLNDLASLPASVLLARTQREGGKVPGIISVVGAGATGIQFLFELAHIIRTQGLDYRIRLIDSEDMVLKQFTPKLSRYVAARLAALGVDYLPNTLYRGHEEDKILLENKDTAEAFELPSQAAWLFLGKMPELLIEANARGQVMVDGETLEHIFTAGDCSHFQSWGSNSMTAQAAIRKGKLAARNILRHSGYLPILEPHFNQDLGYLVSLGPDDAVGWIGWEDNVVAGSPALVVKEIVEAQYDLLLTGTDTYLI